MSTKGKRPDTRDELMRITQTEKDSEKLIDKANQLFDEKASDPVIINNIRKVRSCES